MSSIFASQLPLDMQSFPLTPTQEKAIDRFSGTLEHCKSKLATGMPVVLAGNIQTCFGSDLAGEFFAYQLGLEVGHSVYICNGDDGLCTFVCFASETNNPKNLPPSLGHPSLANLDHKPAENTDTVSTDHAAAPIRKNPPRPMNCWMLYRDQTAREIKDQNPHLSVQEISIVCSRKWKNLPAAKKEEWRTLAREAKEEHQRMYPDYKYSPRKPGQKKKRQSRKSMQAAAKTTAPAPAPIMVMDDLTPMDSTTSPSVNSPVDAVFGAHSFGVPETFMDNINMSLAGDFVGLMHTIPDSASGAHNTIIPDNETDRQEVLHHELEDILQFDFPDLFGDEGFAFKEGADGSATLPSFEEGENF